MAQVIPLNRSTHTASKLKLIDALGLVQNVVNKLKLELNQTKFQVFTLNKRNRVPIELLVQHDLFQVILYNLLK